jgi:hypothetical protein
MKKLTIFLVFLLFNATLFAQTYLDVAPGYGTLNAAITANQGNVIYRLQAGGWYGLNGIIENSGFPLTIVGTTPAAGQMPAEIQTATNADGTVLGYMFNMIGDLTLTNVFLVNADANNSIGMGVFTSASTTPIKVVLDSVTCDPVGTAYCIVFGNTPRPKLFMTNSLFLRRGNLSGANDGWFWTINGGAPNGGFDTLYVENNTFMCGGTGMGSLAAVSGADSNNFVWINHNSFVFQKSQLFWAWHMNSYFVTNNLFFDFMTQPWNRHWNVFFPDGDTTGSQSKLALVNQDTASYDSTNGVLLSQRKLFVEYNSFYTDPRIQAYTTSWAATHTKNNDGVTPLDNAYIMHLMYPPDSAGVNREARMANSAAFPNFFEGNYLDNFIGTNPPNTDPQWTNAKFYAIQDSLVSWTLPAAELNTWGFSANNVNPQPNQAGNWFWNPDTVYNYGNPVVWPRLNASYKNSTMLTASIEGLPLGDLNWFPAAKATWQANKAEIMNHILEENASPMYITSDTNFTWTTIDDTDKSIIYTGSWQIGLWGSDYYDGTAHYTANAGDAAQYTFTGVGIKWIAAMNSDHGQAKVYIDSVYQTTVDLYSSPAQVHQVVYENKGLSKGQHTIKIVCLGLSNPNATAQFIDIDAFEVASSVTSVKTVDSGVPHNFELSQNYPNPFNPTTEIKYSIPKSGIVTLKVYNLLGQEVAALVNQEQKPGNYTVNFDASKLASGVYMYRIQSGDFSLTKKMVLLK